MIAKRKSQSKNIAILLLALLLAITGTPVLPASAEDEPVLVNLLAHDLDTEFDGGLSPFTMDGTSTGGSQQIVQVNGNNALELRDASLGANAASSFYYQQTSGSLVTRLNQIYNQPVGSPAVDFILEYKLLRSDASDMIVSKDNYAYIQLGPYDNVLIPRFPTQMPSITGTAAYTSTVPNELNTINDSDIPSYRFQVVPNGGQKTITSLKLGFTVRVNTGGTDEAYIVDDLAVYEEVPYAEADEEAPTIPTGLTYSAETDTKVNLSWTASTDDIGVTRYDIYQNGTLAAFVSGSTTSYSVVGLSPNTTYDYTVRARDAAGNVSGHSNEVTVTTDPSPGGLPEPFGNQDIGSVGIAGSASYDELTDTYSLQGSGADIWGTADAFQYAYRPWTGDGQIVARVSGISNGVAWTKTGVMIRENVSPQSRHALVAVTPNNGVVFSDRLEPGGASTLATGTTGVTAPYWVKLVRAGNYVSSYSSYDGTTWTLIKKELVNLPQTVYFGLALTSHSNTRLTTATFDHVAIGEVPPPESTFAPFPGTLETRQQWLWNKAKSMSEIGGLPNIVQIVAQILDNQNVANNMGKLDTMFQTYDWEQYKTVGKMYAYLMLGDRFDSTMLGHVRDYFAGYAYAKLPQTENLRMSNYATGYLVGQYFPDLEDLNGSSGAALKSANRANVEEMIDKGVHEGWAEYESTEYTYMTYLCLNALYQYTDEPDFKQKIKMAMDVMWFEWANDWIDGTFISSVSRAKGDSSSASDPSWRATDHSALSWMYFGAHRAQEGIGETDAMVPASYRPYLEYLALLIAPEMEYAPPEMAVRIGQSTKDYTSRKTNLQNSSGRNLKVFRQAYVKPTWGIATEVTYNRVDNWIEDLPVVLRWQSSEANPLFRVVADQADTPIGNYDQPDNHRVMQDGKTAVAVYKSLKAPGASDSVLTAMFPDTGSILTRSEQSGWVFAETEQMYFAFKTIKPYTWHYQTPTDPANKVKTTITLHPTKQLTYNYNILRSKADKNGWVLETAGVSEYADFAGFKNAILTQTSLDSSHIEEANPRLIFTNLSGDELDLTFDLGSSAYANTHKVNGTAIDYSSFKLFDTPWLQQEPNGELFVASQGGERLTYNFADWTITESDPNAVVGVTGVTLNQPTITVGAGTTSTLSAAVQPADATNKAVAWSSGNPSVATVSSNGTVTGVAPGTAVITATTDDGSFTATSTVTVVYEPLFEEGFAGGLGNWDLFGSTAWQIQGSGSTAKLNGSTTLTGPQRAVVKTSSLAYSTQDYSLAFTAASDRFRMLFRYSSGTSYYFLEFKSSDIVELWKYPNTSTPAQVGTAIDIGTVIPGFDMTASHSYRIDVDGDDFGLYIDGTLITTFTDSTLTAGGVGFSVKSVGPAVNLLVDEVSVLPL
ncbi:Ig-like domain-containing protein [Cohnella lupini]|uniref:Fibronectin type III domain protein n=1 Tax=Cohnella lupini TaxID=1294267 RepID=A0A3D9IUN5_9BACL|nr:Ig-like domain-containing protein [Cohnella lupini]RED64836.1 fibronectin type III domain protein [Cohnella lupini]